MNEPRCLKSVHCGYHASGAAAIGQGDFQDLDELLCVEKERIHIERLQSGTIMPGNDRRTYDGRTFDMY